MNYEDVQYREKRTDKNVQRMRHPKKKVVPSKYKMRGYHNGVDKRREPAGSET